MTIKKVVGDPKVFSVELDYNDLLTTTFGAQGAITVHDLIPEGWEVYGVEVRTLTSFNGSGTRALDLGVTGAPTAIFTGLDVKSAAIKAPTVTRYLSTAPVAIIATLTTGTDNPTAGKLLITLFLAPLRREN